MQGFIVMDYAKENQEARKQLGQWLSEGKIKREETIVKGGLQNVEKAFNDLFEGGNKGRPSFSPAIRKIDWVKTRLLTLCRQAVARGQESGRGCKAVRPNQMQQPVPFFLTRYCDVSDL
jgi:hypothetical protein